MNDNDWLFNASDMSPDDCVRLVDVVNDVIINELSRAAEEESILDLDRESIMEMMFSITGMEFGDITRFCEIGEYIMLDRQTRGISQEEADQWKRKREAAVAVIDAMVQHAISIGAVNKEDMDVDPTIEALEEIWKLS
jgi:hypothetical protein